MSIAEKNVRLSEREVGYLRQASFLPPPLARIVMSVAPEDGVAVIRVSGEVAERFRSAFTDRLARVGFNANDEPTDEGRMLEKLIDRFFLKDDA